MLLPADLGLHAHLQRAIRRGRNRQCPQGDLRVVCGVKQRRAQHVSSGSLPGRVRHIRRKVAVLFPGTQRSLVHAQIKQRYVRFETDARQVLGQVNRPAEGMRGNHMIVSGAGERAATEHEDRQQGLLRHDVIGPS